MKEITVVMPVYKVEKYVSECLDSIINQTFDCFECIIIDDCSPDNSMRLIEEKLAGYKGNISFRIVRNERNEGVSAARNKGIELSRGGYLFFIDSDDMLYENCLEKLWEETKIHPGIDLVQGDSYSEGMENKNSDLQRYTEGRIRINKLFLDSKIISTPVNRLIRKEVLTENAIQVAKNAFELMELSARSYHRILKVSRTIADMEGEELIHTRHVAEALTYKAFDKKYRS